MIRDMGGLGQSSDPHKASYNKEGLPLVPGLIELITKDSSRPGQRHAALRKYVGQVAIKAWQGNPADPKTEDGGVGGEPRAVSWVPYQKPTFVTPAFPGYISGTAPSAVPAHEVLAAITGSAFFPGGLGEWTFEPGKLTFEKGPAVPVTLQWATYFDASDQAGRSRLYGGIHIPGTTSRVASWARTPARRRGRWRAVLRRDRHALSEARRSVAEELGNVTGPVVAGHRESRFATEPRTCREASSLRDGQAAVGDGRRASARRPAQ